MSIRASVILEGLWSEPIFDHASPAKAATSGNGRAT
jgi:hypothetical protein